MQEDYDSESVTNTLSYSDYVLTQDGGKQALHQEHENRKVKGAHRNAQKIPRG